MGNKIRCGVLSTNVYNKMVYNLTIDRRFNDTYIVSKYCSGFQALTNNMDI